MTSKQSADALKEKPGPDAATTAAVGAGVMGALFTIGAAAAVGPRTALSVGVGAVIATSNLVAMSAILRALLRSSSDGDPNAAANGNAAANANASPNADASSSADLPDARSSADGEESTPEPDHVAEGKRGGAAWGAFAAIKMLALFGGIWILLTRGIVDPIPLVVGYGVLPLGIAASGLLTSLAPRSRKQYGARTATNRRKT